MQEIIVSEMTILCGVLISGQCLVRSFLVEAVAVQPLFTHVTKLAPNTAGFTDRSNTQSHMRHGEICSSVRNDLPQQRRLRAVLGLPLRCRRRYKPVSADSSRFVIIRRASRRCIEESTIHPHKQRVLAGDVWVVPQSGSP